jgi:hypothetical protein
MLPSLYLLTPLTPLSFTLHIILDDVLAIPLISGPIPAALFVFGPLVDV